MECLVVGFHSTGVASCLPPQCLGCLRLASRGVHAELEPHIAAQCHDALVVLVPDEAVREHYREVLGVSDAISVLSRRRWLLQARASSNYRALYTQNTVGRTELARLMTGSTIDGPDLFNALKRASLASYVPALAGLPGVVCWMNVLGAVEEKDPMLVRLLGSEAWEAIIGEVGIGSKRILWAVQHAHFAEALEDVGSWLLVKGGPSIAELNLGLQALIEQLEGNPSAGRYGPPEETSRVTATHVKRVMRALARKPAGRSS